MSSYCLLVSTFSDEKMVENLTEDSLYLMNSLSVATQEYLCLSAV